MKIEHKDEHDSGMFYVMVDGKMGAQMTYTKPAPGILQINHTEVAPALRHENLGSKLVEAAVAYARSNSKKIQPVCPFVKAAFAKKADYNDVLAQ